jgi:hypothetical protein
MNDAQTHFGSSYAHFGACTWTGSTKMSLGTSKHILDWGNEHPGTKEAGSTLYSLQ